MKQFDFSVLKDYKLYTFLVAISKWLRHIMYRPCKVYGLENLPKSGEKLIFASNHVNAKDPGVISILAGPRFKIHYMGKNELFQNPVAFWLLQHFNSFPINRGKHDVTSINYAVQVLQTGRSLGMFIEGSRTRDGKLQSPKPGTAMIARETGASILPISVYSEHKGDFFKPLTIRFGKVIPFAELQFDGSGEWQEVETVSDQIMDEIRKLWEMGY